MSTYKTDQEAFWAGDFGDKYILRNMDPALLAGRINLFTKILNVSGPVASALEVGPNIGMNMKALEILVPEIRLTGVEINKEAAEVLQENRNYSVVNASILDFQTEERFNLVYSRGVLIHINPDMLPEIYDKMYALSDKFILVAEYYNPSPVMIPYRGENNRLFKRDFAGELLTRFTDLKLAGYGFEYHRDPLFPQDDITWFLLRKE